MNSTPVRSVAVVVASALLLVVGLAGPSGAAVGARRATKNTKFCEVFSDGGDLQTDLNPDSADFAIQRIAKLLATDPPAKIKKALKTIRKVYRRIAAGETASEQLVTAAKSFTAFSKYVVSNCRS